MWRMREPRSVGIGNFTPGTVVTVDGEDVTSTPIIEAHEAPGYVLRYRTDGNGDVIDPIDIERLIGEVIITLPTDADVGPR